MQEVLISPIIALDEEGKCSYGMITLCFSFDNADISVQQSMALRHQIILDLPRKISGKFILLIR